MTKVRDRSDERRMFNILAYKQSIIRLFSTNAQKKWMEATYWYSFIYEFNLDQKATDAARNIKKAFGVHKKKESYIDCTKSSDETISIWKMNHFDLQHFSRKTAKCKHVRV